MSSTNCFTEINTFYYLYILFILIKYILALSMKETLSWRSYSYNLFVLLTLFELLLRILTNLSDKLF